MKRIALNIIALFVLVTFLGSFSSTVQAQTSSGVPMSLKERWKQLPSDLQLTSTQMEQYKEYAEELHQSISHEHHKMTEKLKKFLTSEEIENLKEWGKAYRAQNEEHTRLSDAEMTKSLEGASQQLNLTPEQEKHLRSISMEHHHKINHLLDRFYAKLNKILTSSQQEKLLEWRERL